MKLLFLLFLVIAFIGCQRKPGETNGTGKINELIPIYKVDLDQVKKVSVYDIFSNVDVIPLETSDSVLCGGIHSYVYKDNVFFWDRRQDIILCFDTAGRYQYQINSRGRGAEEYYNILCVSIDRFNDYITIADMLGILQFDMSGSFVRRIRYPGDMRAVHSTMMINRDTIFCVTATSTGQECKIINYISLKENKIIASCYSEDHVFPVNREVSYYNGKSSYCIPKSPFIYSINQLELIPEYQWDFGKYNYNYKDLSMPQLKEEKDIQKIQVPWLVENCPWLMNQIAENSNHLYAVVSFFKNANYLKGEIPTYHIFRDKKAGKNKVIARFEEGEIFHGFSSWTDQAVYCAVEKRMIPEYMNIEKLTPENRKIVEELSDDANPVLLKYTFRK